MLNYVPLFQSYDLTPKDPGGGAKKSHTIFNRLFHHFAGNFLLFLVIDFS